MKLRRRHQAVEETLQTSEGLQAEEDVEWARRAQAALSEARERVYEPEQIDDEPEWNPHPNWHGCGLANPFCPDDLCTLKPHEHLGLGRGFHRLETMSEPMVLPMDAYRTVTVTPRTTWRDIVAAGLVREEELFGDTGRPQ